MADTTLNNFVSSGTAAERAAYTPSPPTPASGPDPGYFFFETDTGLTYSWNGAAWVQTGGGGANSVTAAGTLTANRIVLGAGSKTVAELGSLGTTTTVLHGNAAGAPTFAAVSLTADVTGTLPVANGGTGVSANFSPMLVVSGSVNDATIKALPTTGVEMVGAPGANIRIKPIALSLLLDASAGAYTNITAAYSDLAIYYSTSGKWLALPLINDNSLTTPLAHVSSFFGNAQTRVLDVQFPYLDTVNNAGASGSRTYIDYLANAGMASIAQAANNGVSFKSGNTGDFTGGNAANTLKYRFYYVLEATT